MDAVKRLRELLPAEIREAAGELPDDLTEMRVRAGRAVQLIGLSGETCRDRPVGAEQVERLCAALAGHSLYAREEELREGYFTMEGGCRVGVCGQMTVRDGSVEGIARIGSVCVRVAREVRGAADGVMDALYEAGRPVSALVISPPGLGKTTLLRDIGRQLSDGTGGRQGVKVGMADERGELAGMVMGRPSLDVGMRTDVTDGCPKRAAMPMLIRAMSPEVIVTDELGHPGDAEAVADAVRTGVRVIASVHARDEEEAVRRLRGTDVSVFERMIVLGPGIGRVMRVARTEGRMKEWRRA